MEYYMNPPNAVKFSQIKTDIEKGVIPSLSPFEGIDIKPGQFFIDDSAGNVLLMEKKPDNVMFARTYYSNYEWKILQRIMRHYGFGVNVAGSENNIVYGADDFEGIDNYNGKFNEVPADYAKAYREGVGSIASPMPHNAPAEYVRVFKEGVETMPTHKILNVPEDYAKVYVEGVEVIPAPMPRVADGTWGRKYRYIKYRETDGKVSRIQ